MIDSPDPKPNQPEPGLLLGNLGQPIKLTELNIGGVLAETIPNGKTGKIYTRLHLTSYHPHFNRFADELHRLIQKRAAQAGHAVDLTRASRTLLVIHPDCTGDLWLDTAACSLNIVAKKSLSAGTAIFENDIADVIAMTFPIVDIGKKDCVVCIFREGWHFALLFDFNPEGDLSIENMERDLGTLYRQLKYRDLYDALADPKIVERLSDAGWFPFVEILGAEFHQLADHCEAGIDLEQIEEKLAAAFDAKRIEKMFERWMSKPHFAGKERLLQSALSNFASQ